MRYDTPSFVGITSVMLSALMLAGCPAGSELENPNAYRGGLAGSPGATGGAPGTGGGNGDTGGGNGTLDCDMEPILLKCAGSTCHGGPEATGGVDLISPGVEERLIGVEATYPHVEDPESCPQTPELLLDPEDIENSLMMRKLRGTHSCGRLMPFSFALPAEEIECMKQWLEEMIPGGEQ